LFRFFVLNSFNEDDIKTQTTNLAEIYSNRGDQLSLTHSKSWTKCSFSKIGLPNVPMQRTSNFSLRQRI